MMTNRSRVVLYTGITNSLVRRVWQHQSGEIEGFTNPTRPIDSCITSVSMIPETRSHMKRKSRAGGARRRMHWSKRRIPSGPIYRRCFFNMSNVLRILQQFEVPTMIDPSSEYFAYFVGSLASLG